MVTPPPDVWTNPLQRFGFIDVNVLIGSGIEEEDRDRFFGPLRADDIATGKAIP